MNFSQEVVQEFQLSAMNFDLSTGITAVGSVNIVTRSGSNDFHGKRLLLLPGPQHGRLSGFEAQTPSIQIPSSRAQSGFWVGGPIFKDKLFFFFNLENQNQASALLSNPIWRV